MTLRLGVLGASGRMGQSVLRVIASFPRIRAAATLSQASTDAEFQATARLCDAVIDFSTPSALERYLRLAPNTPLVSGTTGLPPRLHKKLEARARTTPTFHSPNFSIGVFLMTEALEAWGPHWRKLGYSARLTDVHHVHKKDAPSGTALRLSAAARLKPREIQSRREGEIVGDHTLVLDHPLETLTLSHHAKDRDVFARGAVEAAQWLHRQRGPRALRLFSMKDFLK